jgi:hypothetical protein
MSVEQIQDVTGHHHENYVKSIRNLIVPYAIAFRPAYIFPLSYIKWNRGRIRKKADDSSGPSLPISCHAEVPVVLHWVREGSSVEKMHSYIWAL